MDFTLSQKIAQSAVTDERADNLELSPGEGNKLVPLTEQEKQERMERVRAAEERAFNTSDDEDRVWIKAAFENDTAQGATLFEMGGGDDTFFFGDFGGSNIVSEVLAVDMGQGQNDTVVLWHSIEDYTFSMDANGDIIVFNQTSGIEIAFSGAEQFTFQNRGVKTGIEYDFNDTSFSVEEMIAVASGEAAADIAVAEFIADSAMSTLGIDAGEDGVYVDISIG
ncbi:MAG: hypothetical protein AB8B85_06000 [Paracoccaceae bacterium]